MLFDSVPQPVKTISSSFAPISWATWARAVEIAFFTTRLAR